MDIGYDQTLMADADTSPEVDAEDDQTRSRRQPMANIEKPQAASFHLPPSDSEDQPTDSINLAKGAVDSLVGLSQPDTKRARVMMRFDPTLLERIDAAAKRRGVSRTAWLHMVASRALDQGDG